MTRTIPSAKQMGDSRKTHYFRDEDDNRLAVVTVLLPNGVEYCAYVEGSDANTAPYGIGTTMMEAIADLYDEMADKWRQSVRPE